MKPVVSGRIYLLIAKWLELQPLGRILYAPFDIKLSAYRRADHGFGPVVELSVAAGDAVRTPLLPGLQLPLADIFKS